MKHMFVRFIARDMNVDEFQRTVNGDKLTTE